MRYLLLTLTILVFCTSFAIGQNYYLGVYNPNITPNCATCHAGRIATWETTGHAIAQDSVSSAFFGFSCLGCHNTGWDTSLVNYGADEYVVQDTLQSPDYVITDSTKWNLVKNVQCEQCHGPVGKSDGTLDFTHTSRTTDFSADVCGVCHQDVHHPYLEEWQLSAHANSIPVFFNRTNNGPCFRCHTAQDYIAFKTDSANYNGTTFVPEGIQADLTCVTCHDPHGNDNPGNLREPITGDHVICDDCHTVETDTVDVNETPHHTTSEVLSGSPLFGYQYPGQSYQNSAHTFVATERCVNCHVFMTPFSDPNPAGTGHTFYPRVEACASCHGDYYAVVDTSNHDARFDYRGIQSRIDSLITVLHDELAMATPADSQTFAFKAAAYNLHAIEAEGSRGIHNTKLVQALLEDAITDFTPTGIEPLKIIPLAYSLGQNYPNPFNPVTNIDFSIIKAGKVTIKVFDILGRSVATIVDERMDAGSYTAKFDAALLASGIYIYRINTDKFVDFKKMVLLK